MYKTTLLLIFLWEMIFCNAQIEPIAYKIVASKPHFYNSNYSSIQFLDSRRNTIDLGFLQLRKGFQIPVIPSYNIEQQFFDLFDASIDKTVDKKTLIFQLRRLAFSEIVDGYCDVRAEIYSKNENSYQKIALLDTIIVFDHHGTFNNKFQERLLSACDNTLSEFLGSALIMLPIDTTSYSEKDILNIENIEKSKLPLYTCEKFTDGFYKSYSTFKNQQPDQMGLTVKFKNDKIKGIVKGYETESETNIDPYDIYAVVYKGKCYISTDYGYYELMKKDNNFSFIGKENVSNVNGNSFGGTGRLLGLGIGGPITGAVGGILGTILSPVTGSEKSIFEIQIDHLNGRHILLRQVEKE